MRLTRRVLIAAVGMAVGMALSAAQAGENITYALVNKDKVVLTAAGSPYTVGTGWLVATEGKELVIGPGVEIRFVYDPRHSAPGLDSAGLAVWKGGRLSIQGTPEQPVILTAGIDDILKAGKPNGYWFGIAIEDGGSASIAGAVFRYTRDPAIRVRKGGTASVRTSTFELGGMGLLLHDGAKVSAIDGCRFRKGTSPVAWATENNVQVASSRGNVSDAGMHVDVGNFLRPGAYRLGPLGKAGAKPLPYYISSARGIEVGSPEGQVELTIEPGTAFMAQQSYSTGGLFHHSSLRVQHNASLNVLGEKAAPVLFTAEPDENGKKAPGTWGGIIFEKTCGTAKSRVRYANLEYGASLAHEAQGNRYHARGMISILGGDVDVHECTFTYAGGAGLYVTEAQPKVTSCDFLNNQIGLDFEDVKSFGVGGCWIAGNKAFGARCNDCNGGKIAMNMVANGWGHISGPLDDSDDRATGGGHNPTGKGDKVSDYIQYSPWKTSKDGDVTPPPPPPPPPAADPKVAITTDGLKDGGQYKVGQEFPTKVKLKTPIDIKTYTATLNGEHIASNDGRQPIKAERTDDLLCSFAITPKPGKNVFVIEGALVDGTPFTKTITFTGAEGDTPPPPPPPPTEPTLLVDSITAPSGETITITITLAGVKLLRSLNWELLYDAKVLEVVKALPGDVLTTAGALFQENVREAGRIRFGFADKEGVRPGPLAHVEFRIIGAEGSKSTLTLKDAKGNDSDDKPVLLTLENGIVTVKAKSKKGDDNGDDVVDVRDAMAALMMSVGNRKEDLILDMDTSGKVEARDAELILRQIVGK